jgi:hypothetical protein
VGNGYIIYKATDSDAAKWSCNCRRNSHGNSWIFTIAVLLPEAILERMLLGSFHWVSNEEIPTLTFAGECVYIDSAHMPELKVQSTYFSYANLFVELLHGYWTNHGWEDSQ